MIAPIIAIELQTDRLQRWRSLVQACRNQGILPPSDSDVLEGVKTALLFSDYVFRELERRPDLLIDLLASGNLPSAYDTGGMAKQFDRLWRLACDAPEPAGDIADASAADISKETLMKTLRTFRRREMVRIALRDICGWAVLEQTLADLTDLADTAIAAALRLLQRQQVALWGQPCDAAGQPIRLVVLGLGKLGAGELNFSSDVDLMFAYPAEGHTQGGARGTTDAASFFTRLCRDLIQVLGAVTEDGFVFRVDARLRPFGEAGPLVMSFERLEDYYQAQGREWERYALIKARVAAGDATAGRRLLDRLKPFVFRRYLDYGAFDSLRDMKNRISLEVRSKGLQDNIKLGSGGIREIEFFGQMFQLIRGGVTPELQIRPIRQVLAILAQKRLIPDPVARELDAAYVFLRFVENRVQQWADRQVHLLPSEPMARLRLAAAMGFEGWASFSRQLDHHRAHVRTHFSALLAPAQAHTPLDPEKEMSKQLTALWQGVLEPGKADALLTHLGFSSAQEVIQQITALKQDRTLRDMSQVGRERLNRLIPMIVQAAASSAQPDQTLQRLFHLIRSIQQRTSYLALLVENPSILKHVVHLAGASPWIADFLSRHPVLLDELLDPRTLYRPPDRKMLAEELTQRLTRIAGDDLEYQMEALRVYKQVNVLRVAASDMTSVLPLMKVSDHLSDIAEVILDQVVHLCFDQLAAKHGWPACSVGNGRCERGFVVIAYGKLGGLELGYGSDLDLVFLHAAEAGQTSNPNRPLDNAQFFSRLGQRVLHMLTTPTGAGIVYDADMRLRPSGASGMLVSHIEGFGRYQRDDAWTWEHQALIRARAVTGDAALKNRFETIRRQILTRARDAQKLKAHVADMRLRLKKQSPTAAKGLFDIKQGAGGIVDIEFLVQYLVLRHAHDHPQIVRWTDNVRLIQSLNETGILAPDTAFGLRRAYLIFRAMVHRLNLAQSPVTVANARFDQLRRFVMQSWQRHLGNAPAPVSCESFGKGSARPDESE